MATTGEAAADRTSSVRRRDLPSNDDGDVQQEGFRIKKRLTLIDGILLNVGVIIGSGIFISPKGVLQNAGSVGLSLIIWLVCGICSLLGALVMSELGTSIKKFGGEYIYIYEAFGPLPGFLKLWISMVVLRPTGQAIILLVCADYIVYPLFSECNVTPELPIRLIALAAVLFLSFLNCSGTKWTVRFTNVLSNTKLFATAVIIGTGLYYLGTGHTENFENAFANSTNSVGNIALAMYSGLWAYSGWSSTNYVAEEMKNIKRNLPLAIISAVTLVTITYVLTITAYFSVLSPQELLRADAVAVTFADTSLGVMSWIMPVFVALSTLGAANGSLFLTSRIYFSGAREGQLPDIFAMIHVTKRTPLPAFLMHTILVCIMIQIREINTLINYFSFVEWLSILTCVVGLMWLRFKRPDLDRPIKLPLLIPIIFSLFALFLVVVPFYAEPLVSLTGLAVTLSGVPVYLLGQLYRKKKPKAMVKVLGTFTWFCQMYLQVSLTDH
ncbi:Y+L amino acid transporter 2-like [Ptychodera flava]|uniref:Y+L amino acid transporter 2-like n=1 Tax=Ptychodera flava TaxID=63121 RepID=UPI00396A3199